MGSLVLAKIPRDLGFQLYSDPITVTHHISPPQAARTAAPPPPCSAPGRGSPPTAARTAECPAAKSWSLQAQLSAAALLTVLVVCSVTPLIHFLVLPILTGISRLGRVSSVAMAGESGSLVTGSGLGSRPRLQSRAVSSTEVHEVSQCSEKGPC